MWKILAEGTNIVSEPIKVLISRILLELQEPNCLLHERYLDITLLTEIIYLTLVLLLSIFLLCVLHSLFSEMSEICQLLSLWHIMSTH